MGFFKVLFVIIIAQHNSSDESSSFDWDIPQHMVWKGFSQKQIASRSIESGSLVLYPVNIG